jgi:membrane protease YdiL (CAAX protease family)
VAGVLFAIVTALTVVCAVVGVGVVAGRPGGRYGLPSFGALGDTAWQSLVLAAFVPPLMIAARVWQRRPAGTLSSVCGRLRLRWLAACLAVAVAAEIGYTWFEGPLEPGASASGFAVAVPVLLVVVPLEAAAQEYLFRGWLLQSISGRWAAMAVSATLFALVHGLGTVWGFLDLVAFGLVTGWLTVRTGGLEAGIALHVATNLVDAVWQAATGTLASTETAADSTWGMTAVDVTVVVLYAIVVAWLARSCGIATVVPGYRRGGTGIRSRSEATTMSPANSSAASTPNRDGSG